MHKLKTMNVRNKRVLLRTGYDVTVKNGKVVDDARIRESLPTIKYLLAQKAIVIIITHLGRPNGKAVPELSTRPVAKRLSQLTGQKVIYLDNCIDVDLSSAKPGEIYMLENLRFYSEEEENNKEFAKKLASLADVYINDAFSVAHRKHASIIGIPQYLPHAAGLLMEKEVQILSKLLANPEHPYIAVLGGVKVSDKAGVIKNLLKKADAILTGGALALSLYKSIGTGVGQSKAEHYKSSAALLRSKKIILPVDFTALVGDKVRIVQHNAIPKDAYCRDNGPETTNVFIEILKKAKTIVWNGPTGLFEDERFASSSCRITKEIAENKGLTVAGGGNTLELINKLKLAGRYSHVSTGGGAMLEFLEGKTLPGIKALK